MFFWRGKGVLHGKGRLVCARVVCRGDTTSSPNGGAENRLRCVDLLGRGVAERRRRDCLDLGFSPSPQICDRRGGNAGAMITCD